VRSCRGEECSGAGRLTLPFVFVDGVYLSVFLLLHILAAATWMVRSCRQCGKATTSLWCCAVSVAYFVDSFFVVHNSKLQ